jgi:hypothetical protein
MLRVSPCTGLAGSDRDFLALTGRGVMSALILVL